MVIFETESGAVYHVDQENRRVMRTGPYSKGIDYLSVPDDVWQEYVSADWGTDEIGSRVAFILRNGLYRVTTPVVRYISE